MEEFKVIATIENKSGLSDPEGRTILKDLVLKEGKKKYDCDDGDKRKDTDVNHILDIRTAKMLKFTIKSASANAAINEIKGVCERLHIYNPITSTLCVTIEHTTQK